jgi:hypothetical protein
VSTQNDLNTLPIQQFINAVKGADASKQREIKMDIQTAKRLAFTLGEVMAKMNGELEQLLIKKQAQEEVIKVELDGGSGWK